MLHSSFPSWMPLSPLERWYVVRTQPQCEAQATKQLANQDFRVFFPRYLKNCRHARKVETMRAALFPQYLFTILDLGTDQWRSINGTLGVHRLLMSGGDPQPVPHGLVEGIIQAAYQDGTVHFDFNLREGQLIGSGPGPSPISLVALKRSTTKGA